MAWSHLTLHLQPVEVLGQLKRKDEHLQLLARDWEEKACTHTDVRDVRKG